MRNFWWMIVGAVATGAATYLIVKKLMANQGGMGIDIPSSLFGRSQNHRFDDLNRVFDGVDADLEEPWL